MPYLPMLASSSPVPPTGDEWVFEPKWDGFRSLVAIDGAGACRIRSRHGRSWTAEFPELGALGPAIGRPVVLDGETIVVGEDGRPSFEALSARLTGGRRPQAPATFVAFDVLEVDGRPLLDQPWTARRRILADLALDGDRAVVTMTCDDGAALLAATRQLGVEGIVAKRRRAGYLCGRRSRSWLKIKHRSEAWFDLVGWRPPTGARSGAVVVADDGGRRSSALVALPAPERAALRAFVDRHGLPDGATVRIPPGVQVRVTYTERSVRGHLREAAATGLRPRPTLA